MAISTHRSIILSFRNKLAWMRLLCYNIFKKVSFGSRIWLKTWSKTGRLLWYPGNSILKLIFQDLVAGVFSPTSTISQQKTAAPNTGRKTTAGCATNMLIPSFFGICSLAKRKKTSFHLNKELKSKRSWRKLTENCLKRTKCWFIVSLQIGILNQCPILGLIVIGLMKINQIFSKIANLRA